MFSRNRPDNAISGRQHTLRRPVFAVTLNFTNLYIMIQCSEPKVQDQKNGNNTRVVCATDEQRET